CIAVGNIDTACKADKAIDYGNLSVISIIRVCQRGKSHGQESLEFYFTIFLFAHVTNYFWRTKAIHDQADNDSLIGFLFQQIQYLSADIIQVKDIEFHVDGMFGSSQGF